MIIFLHIPKTAGSTFHAILNKRFSKKTTHNVLGSRFSDQSIQDYISLPESTKKRHTMLKGHMPFGLHQYLPENTPFKYISILRDPIERVVSQYYYIKSRPSNPMHETVTKNDMSLADFVTSGVVTGMNNGHCRFINGDMDAIDYNQCSEALFETVKENIDNHYLWLGITERFDESVFVLSKLLNWKSPPYYIRENVSKVRKKARPITDEERSLIEQYNQYDIALYQLANARLDEQISKIENFESEFARYQQKNKQIQNRWSWLPTRLQSFVI